MIPVAPRALLITLIAGLASTPGLGAQTALYAEAEAWAFAEPVPIDDYAGDWRAPLDRGSDGFAFIHLETGVRHGAMRVGIARQRQYVIEASRDAARLYHLDRNDRPAPPDARFNVVVDGQFYDLRGLRLAHGLPAWESPRASVVVEPALTWWEGWALEDGAVTGNATTDGEGELAYSAKLDHVYSRDSILDRPVTVPRGRGASLDLSGRFAVGRTWSGDFAVRNALGRMWWHRAPRTIGQLGSDTRQTDDDGSVNFAPTLSGLETNASHRQRLPLFGTLSLHRALGAHRVTLGLVHTEIDSFPGLGWSHGSDRLRYGLDYFPSARRALQAHVKWGTLHLRIGADNRRWNDAHQLTLRLAFEIPLDRLLPDYRPGSG